MREHLRTALKHIRRSPYQALAAVLTMTLTFFVATVLSILTYASYSTLRYFETRPQIIAFLKDEATGEQVSALQRELAADSRVKNVRYVSKEEALGIYKQATSDNPLLSELVSPKVFPASLEFSASDLAFTQDLIREVGQKPIVDDVGFTLGLGGGVENLQGAIESLQKVTGYLRIGGGIILGFLFASSFLILLVIIGMRVVSRREEIEILKLIGATPAFIRLPFLFEGIIYALGGVVVGWFLTLLLVLYAFPAITSFFGTIPVLPGETLNLLGLFGVILSGEIVLAVVLGAAGSFVATRRFLKF